MKICDFTSIEIEYFNEKCNFTKEEYALFILRSKNVPLEECAENMNVSVSTIKRLNKRVKNKIERVIGLKFLSM